MLIHNYALFWRRENIFWAGRKFPVTSKAFLPVRPMRKWTSESNEESMFCMTTAFGLCTLVKPAQMTIGIYLIG